VSIAERLYDLLAPQARVFLDTRTIRLAEAWDSQISEAQAASRVTAAVISSHSSDSYFLRVEIQKAISMSRQPGSVHRLVPVFLEPPDQLKNTPYGIELLQGLHLYTPENAAEVAQSLIDLLGESRGSPEGRQTAMTQIHRLVAGIRAPAAFQSRKALRQLKEFVLSCHSAVAQEAGINLLKQLLCEPDTPPAGGSAAHDRSVRREILSSIRAFAVQPLRSYFADGELEGLDLYAMDFEGADLANVSFANAFLVESTFSGANLEDASLKNCCIRNVKFAGSTLRNADLTEADWFNATGLTAAQLASVKPGTLLPCPADVQGLMDYLPGKYVYAFENWPSPIQQELRQAWSRYLGDEALAGLRRSSARLRLTVHRAFFSTTGVECLFVNATNLYHTDLEITHVWFRTSPEVHAIRRDRPLPQRLKPQESWETWVPVSELPPAALDAPYGLARARLSTGEVISSAFNDGVPQRGTVPGGPVTLP
jgi:uncharacterized protein YjbI with pentapeptide repeats